MRMRRPSRIAGLLLFTCVAVASLRAVAADRVALLIGNNQYPTAPLRNAANDAHDLGEALKELGFQVIVRQNTSRKQMIDAVREFGQALEGANTALFFYAGHAMQFKDRNYLVPIDAAMGSEEDITFFSVEIGQIFDRMEKARTRFNFIILDACRDNPFASSFTLTSSGLAQMSAPSGTLIAYATAPGSVAADGYGRNGIYTKHILQNIKAPDVPVEIMFKRVREGVERETRHLQTPWDSSSLKGDFVFNATNGRPGEPARVASGPSADASLQIEREFWVSVRESNRPEDVQAYLDKYPNGNFAALARNRLAVLTGGRTKLAEAQPAPERSPANTTAAKPASAPADAKPPGQKAATAAADARTTEPAVASNEEATGRKEPADVPATPAKAPAAPAPTVVAMAKPADEPHTREISPGVHEVTFADGAIYRGAMRGARPEGRGEYLAKSFKYQGEFKDGVRQGNGVYVWENGDRYAGEFANDLPNGRGQFTFANGDSYDGEVKSGVINGRGTYKYKSGNAFEGPFENGKPQGTGIYRFASGDRYEGEMEQGRLQGHGKFFSHDGDRIEGQFVDGKADGKAQYFFTNGDRYEGDVHQGVLTGTGTYYYASGLRYQGEVREARPQGKGVLWLPDGTRLEGEFDNGLAHARGTLVHADGTSAPAQIVEGTVRPLE